ncbi:MAG: HIT domain-containing protein [Chloroflexi bacterium]|nr:HIT domain-containing protein [Chloroflexota bacterium]
MACSFCREVSANLVLLEGPLCYFMGTGDPVLVGSGMILPRAHRETVFDLTHEEWEETLRLLHRAKRLLDEKYMPDGYNVGWNCGPAAGQDTPHAHLHVIPRFNDEPLAGQGIRYHLKQPANRRPASGA